MDMTTTFARIWSIKSPYRLEPGELTTVTLKSGKAKTVIAGPLMYERDGYFFYNSPRVNKADKND